MFLSLVSVIIMLCNSFFSGVTSYAHENTLAATASSNSLSNEKEQESIHLGESNVTNDIQNGGAFYEDVPEAKSCLLGAAQYFHIFAKRANLYAHTNGNLAVADLNGNVNFGTNMHEGLVKKDIAYIQNITNIGSSSFVTAQGGEVIKLFLERIFKLMVVTPHVLW